MERMSQGALQVEVTPRVLRAKEALQTEEVLQIEEALAEQGPAHNLRLRAAYVDISIDGITDDGNAGPSGTNDSPNL